MNTLGGALITVLIYNMYTHSVAGSGDFLLLSGEDFLLLNFANFLLLGA